MPDAAALAAVLLDTRLGATLPAGVSSSAKPLTEDIRLRVASRVAGLRFEHLRPLIVSLERDPVHPSACYVCVDGVDEQPLLLRAAPATSPSSGLFPKSILIGRTFIGPVEAVLNAIPFGPGDGERIVAFAEQVNTVYAPRPFGTRPVIEVRAEDPAGAFPIAFEALRQAERTTGRVAPCLALGEGQEAEAFYFAAVWSAIRAGWRGGYTLSAAESPRIEGVRGRPFETSPTIARQVRLTAGMTREEIFAAF